MPGIISLTESSSYRGYLNSTLSNGAEVRLLDALNSPQRLRVDISKENPMLVLQSASRIDRAGLWRVDIDGDCWLALTAVVCAWEDPPVRWENPTASYERRRSSKWRIHVKFQLSTEHVVEGFILSNTPALRVLRENLAFIACTEVVLTDLRAGREAIHLPFLALNVDHVESWSVLPQGREEELSRVVGDSPSALETGLFVH